MNFDGLYPHYRDRLEDFWGRRGTTAQTARSVAVFDRQVRLSSNDPAAMIAVEDALPLYSMSQPAARPPFFVQFVVREDPVDPGPAPENLGDHIRYTGEAAWLSIQLGAWGHSHVDLAAGRAVAVLSPRLARRPDLVSLYLVNTILTNFFIGDGYGMLHASCLLREGRVLLLMAPHNNGKSTTALHLVLAGYKLVSDSMIFVSPYHDTIRLLGFPVGKVKLRKDIVPLFPQLQSFLTAEPVRNEIKYRVDLRRLNPDLVYDTAVTPTSVELCLLSRNGTPATHLSPASEADVTHAVMLNSLFLDTEAVWRANLAPIERLLATARCHHLAIGTDAGAIVETIDTLWHGETI